jgi:hypothetical protein
MRAVVVCGRSSLLGAALCGGSRLEYEPTAPDKLAVLKDFVEKAKDLRDSIRKS